MKVISFSKGLSHITVIESTNFSFKEMKTAICLLLLIRYVLSFEDLMWSLCPSSPQWSYESPGVHVKNWLKSVADKEDMCSYTPINIKTYHFVSDDVDVTLVDSINDTLTGFGWKIAAHYSNEQPWHAGYFYGKMDRKGYINGNT